jgi:hypothetical protein
VTIGAKIFAVGCSYVQFGENNRPRMLHTTAHLCTALKARDGFDSLHPLQLQILRKSANSEEIPPQIRIKVRIMAFGFSLTWGENQPWKPKPL